MYGGFQRKEQTVVVAIDLEDAYNRVQFKLLMDLLIQYGVSLTLTRWAAGALLERMVVMQLGNCSSSAHNRPATRITALAGPLQSLHQMSGRSEPISTQQDFHTGIWRAHKHYTKHQRIPGGSRNSATTG